MNKNKLLKELRSFPKDKQLDAITKRRIEKDIQNEIKRERMVEIKMKKRNNLKKAMVGIVSAAVLLLVITLFVNEIQFNTSNESADTPPPNEETMNQGENNQTENENNESNENDENAENAENAEEVKTIEEPDAEQVMTDYKDTFLGVQEHANENTDGQLTDFNSMEELISHFKNIMSDDLANWYAEAYFREEDGSVYLLPQDGPTWLKENEPYDVEKVNDEKYKVIQERNNELIGHRNMIYILSYTGGNWIVEEIQSEEIKKG